MEAGREKDLEEMIGETGEMEFKKYTCWPMHTRDQILLYLLAIKVDVDT